MSAHWVWTGTDTTCWSRDCQFCQRAKVTRQPCATIQQMPITARRFSHIHLNLVGPLLRSKEGFNHLLTVVDCSSCWLKAFPLESTSTESIADTFVGGWVARFGVPDHITFDRGPQFCSALWAQLSQHLGTLHHLTTAYHPQTNGMAEKSHRQLKDALQACTASADWPSHLPWVLLGLRAAPKEDSCISSAELLYGAPLVLPSQLPGFPELPPVVFHESSRAAPSNIPTRGPSTPKEPQEVPLLLHGASFVYVHHGGAKPPLSPLTAGHLLWFPALQSSLYWILESATSRSAWTDSSPTLDHPSSLRPPPLAVAALLYRWHLQRRHLGWGVV